MSVYCAHCDAWVTLADPVLLLEHGQPVLAYGPCPQCGERVLRVLPRRRPEGAVKV